MTIIPDDKDWTWVLERPCPECGFDARELDVATTLSRVGDLARAWCEVLRRPDVARRETPGKWSPLEYACHVRDVVRVFDRRLDLMITQDGAHFENWDQDATAIEERYDLQDPTIVAAEITADAQQFAQRFALVEGDLWQHRGVRSNGSEFTIATFALYFLHDLMHHLWDVGAG